MCVCVRVCAQVCLFFFGEFWGRQNWGRRGAWIGGGVRKSFGWGGGRGEEGGKGVVKVRLGERVWSRLGLGEDSRAPQGGVGRADARTSVGCGTGHAARENQHLWRWRWPSAEAFSGPPVAAPKRASYRASNFLSMRAHKFRAIECPLIAVYVTCNTFVAPATPLNALTRSTHKGAPLCAYSFNAKHRFHIVEKTPLSPGWRPAPPPGTAAIPVTRPPCRSPPRRGSRATPRARQSRRGSPAKCPSASRA